MLHRSGFKHLERQGAVVRPAIGRLTYLLLEVLVVEVVYASGLSFADRNGVFPDRYPSHERLLRD